MSSETTVIDPSTALVGHCSTCGVVNAIDLCNTYEHYIEMVMWNRTIRVVSREEAKKLWKNAAKCDCGVVNLASREKYDALVATYKTEQKV